MASSSALPSVSVYYIGIENGTNYDELKNAATNLRPQFDISLGTNSTLADAWATMSKDRRSGRPINLLIVDMDFICECDQESRRKFFSQIAGYSCYKAGLSSSKKTKKKSKKDAKEDNDSTFLEEANAHEIVYKPLTCGIIQDLAKKSLNL